MKNFLLALVFLLGGKTVLAAPCNPTITTGAVTGSPFCAGSAITVSYSFTDCVDAGNIFTLQLSNAVGLFTSPVNIGTIASTNAGTITGIIPITTSFGNGYRVRVVSSLPAVVGSDNGSNFTILTSPIANFTINNAAQCVNGNSFTFTNTSVFGSGTQIWSFGDGGTAGTVNAGRVYSNAGTYPVKLVLTSTNGCKDSITQSVVVHPKPAVSFTPSISSTCAGTAINFNNTSTISSGTNAYNWNFGDGGTSTQTSPNYTYTVAGIYPVKLVATSNNGCKDSVTFNSISIAAKPTAAYTLNTSNACENNQGFVFTNTSSGSIASQTWYFGDGSTSTLTNPPTKTYAFLGVYTSKLVVVGTNGCRDSISQNITVFAKPLVVFSYNNPSCQNTSLNLANSTSLNPAPGTYFWDFGDGNTSTLPNPTKSYATTGGFTIKLVAVNNNGCRDSLSQNINIIPKPTANFTINTGSQCVTGNNFNFTNTSTGSIASQIWYFGDGTTATTLNATKVYATTGNYTVKLVVTGTNGCKDSISQNIIVTPIPNFTISNANQCFSGNSFTFTNTTQGIAPITYAWTYGDGNGSSVTSPTHVYSAIGTYTVKLVATEFGGCKDSISKTVTVSTQPTVSFTIDNSTKCAGTAFNFTNNSTGLAPLSYFWIFGDGNTSTAANPSYAYTVAGSYTVKLITTNGAGCKDSTTLPLTVLAKPTASINLNSITECINTNNFIFSNTSTGNIVGNMWNFGDGNTANTVNATHSYTNTGVYDVKLVVTELNGCKDSSIRTVTVNSKPFVSFTVDNTTQCAGSNFSLANNTSISSGSIIYLWKFSDGTSSTATNPVKAFNTAGPQTIKLVATSNNGCMDSATLNVNVLAKPIPTFSINNTNQCINNNSFSFTNTTMGMLDSQIWYFGDGTTSTQNNPTKTYTTAGVYTVKLVVSSVNGCKDSITNTITVNAKPNPSFSVNNNSQCINTNSFQFTNTTLGTISTINWDFGDGSTSTTNNPIKVYSTSGTYSVKLKVTNSNGCIDSITQVITVLPKPNANFTVNANSQCVNSNSFIFTNTSSGSIASQIWTYGNGGTSNGVNGSTVYPTVGTFGVKLVILGTNGCKDSITQNVTVVAKPTPDFLINNTSQCIDGNNFSFTNNSAGSIASTTWSFGDGSTSTQPNPTKTYAAVGSFSVKLVVVNTSGCKDSITKVVNVLAKPIPNFTFPNTSCFTNNQVSFTNTSTGALNYVWDFGDNTTSNAVNPIKTYASGTYNVKLIATGTGGCSDSVTKSITVNPSPIANFTIAQNNLCVGAVFNFTNTSTGNLGSYLWSFGDGTTSTITNTTKVYNTAGSYNVKLVFTAANGCKDSITQVVNVLTKPNLSFNITGFVPCNFGSTLSFNNTSTGASTYLWKFGDGTTSTTPSPTKAYTTAGTYTVRLIGTGAGGCTDSTEQLITLQAKPTASYTVNNFTQCVGGTFAFTNTTTGTISSQTWFFGDGTFSPLLNPTKAYSTAGVYPVKLVVTDVSGCKDSITANVTVVGKPIPSFAIPGLAACSGSLSINLNNTSTGATSYVWQFGDGTTSTLANPSKTYTNFGAYTIKLIATNGSGCVDSVSQNIVLDAKPTAAYTVNNATQCVGGTFAFTNTSTGNIANQTWYFGDGTFSPLLNPTKAYATAGVYAVKLVVVGTNGCKDSVTTNVTVNTKPAPFFTIPGLAACNGSLSINLNNTSTGATSYVWQFGDGTTSTLANPSKTYTNFGAYTVKLIATNGSGCIDSISQNIVLDAKPTASYTVNNTIQCLGVNNFQFTNTSTGSIANQTWFFGDGTFSPLSSPSKAYAAAGIYAVKLVVVGTNGCRDSVTTNVTVNSKPNPAFNLVGFTPCSGSLNISLNNTSTNATNYVWQFGDGTTSTLTNPSKTYAIGGAYTIKLIATNANGCVDSVSQTINLTAKPVPSFTVNNSAQCVTGNSFVFNNTSIPNGIPYHYWNFGDGTNSQDANPIKTYLVAGTYTVKYFLTNENNCKDSVITAVTVLPQSIAAFTVNNSTQCLTGNNFQFNSNTSSNASTFSWSFGDGTFSNTPNPSKIYTAVGNYSVKLVVTSVGGCKDSITQVVNVVASPSISFTPTITTCSLSVSLNNTSTNATGFTWHFGDGTTSTLPNPTKTYNTAGTYTIKLIGNNGVCRDSVSQTITVNSKPIPSFTNNSTGGCTSNLNVGFTNSSTGATSYVWQFGDGSTSTLTNPSKTYTSFGIYTVKLIATNAAGCSDSVTQVISLQQKPIASFTTNNATQCLGSNSFAFTNNSTVAPGIVAYFWNFGDGTVSQDQNPVKTYLAAGTYTVSLFVTNPNGCKDTTTRTVTVTAKPNPAFNLVNFNACSSNTSVSFANTSTGATSYVWQFGDGTTSTLTNPSKTYAGFGIYTVKLIAINSSGCSDSVTQVINLQPKPIASFNVNNATQCLTANSFAFTNNSTVAPGIVAYFWNFGDGTVSQDQNPVKTYLAAGTYTVSLFVTNPNGCKDTTTRTVTVSNKPNVSFTIANFNPCSSTNSVSFTNTSTNATSYLWRFGDGTTTNVVNPTKVYSLVGSYTITLVATSANGCVDSVSQTITMIPKPIASFNLSSITGCINTTVTTTNTSTMLNNPSYLWQFGDGSTSTLPNPTKQYTTAGNYTIRLIVTNANGCIDTAIQFVNIVAKPQATIAVNNASQCFAGNNFVLNGSSSVGAVSYLWKFSDSTTLSGSTVNKTFIRSQAAPFVWLIVTNSNGCVDSTILNLNLLSSPAANFSFVPDACGNNISFTNTSLNATSYTWRFGDGTTSNAVTPPTKNYATAGSYMVRLIATNGICTDSIAKIVTVAAKPTASFLVSNYNACSNTATNTLNFINTSTGSVSTFNWSFGDGTTSTQVNPSKTYTAYGSYTVKLVIATTSGCTDSITQVIQFGAKPIPAFSVNTANQCLVGNSFAFTNTSTNATSYLWSFGDGTTSTALNTSKTYTNAGSYIVKLFVNNGFGCTDSLQTVVNVIAAPIATFTVNNTSQCLSGNSFVLTATTPVVGNTYTWRFSDGTTATGTTVSKSFTQINSYAVTLVVRNASNCVDSSTQNVTILPGSTARFTANIDSCSQTVNFVNSSIGGIQGFPFLWTFGDGTTSQLPNPTKTYTNAGTYTVKLVVFSRFCSDSVTQVINIAPKINAAFTTNNYTECTANSINTIGFTNNSTGSIQTYFWSFGDGSFSNLANPTKTYVALGSYTVKLVATAPNGCKDSVTQTIVFNQKPVAGFTVSNPVQCLTGNNFTFTNTTLNGFRLDWDFGDGTTSSLRGSPTKTYTAAGTYLVKMVASNILGCKDSIQQFVTVNAMPNATFTVNNSYQCIQGNVFTYTSNAVPATIAGYSWNLGDNSFSLLPNITKVYTAAGNYVITLITQGVNGCIDSSKQTITVVEKPNPQFTTTGATCAGNAITFTNTTVTTATTGYVWSFGDGTTSNAVSPSKTYLLPGTYTVKLVAVNIAGCRDSVVQTVTILTRPLASFTASDTLVCAGSAINFTNLSTGSIASNAWAFGDGTTSTQLNPTKTYTTGGTYTVSLTVTSANGCSHTVSKTIVVSAKPTPSFVVNSIAQCVNSNSFIFTNTSTNVTPTTTYAWDLGDGTVILNQSTVTKTYLAVGTYRVRLLATNNLACSDTAFMLINVNPLPAAQISGSQSSCAGVPVTINFNLIGTAPFSFTYTDGQTNFPVTGVTTNTYSVTHAPASTRTYTLVSMRDASSCNQANNTITGSAVITINNTFSITSQPRDTGACFGGNAAFFVTATSNQPISYQWRRNGVNIPGATSSGLQVNNISFSDLGKYTCAITSVCGIISTDTAILTGDIVPPQPVVSAITLCQGTTAAPLTALGSNLRWYNTATGGIGSSVAPIPSTAIAGNQTYWVTSSSNFCESPRTPLQVSVLLRPSTSIAVNPTNGILPNQTATITVTTNPTGMGISYRWFLNGLLQSIGTSNNLPVNFSQLGKYYAELVLPNGCRVSTDTVEVKVRDNFALALAQGKLFITPNPAKGNANVYFNVPINQAVVVRLVDTWGRILQSQTVPNVVAYQRINLDLKYIIPGNYYIEVLDGKGRSVARDIIMVVK